MKGKVLLTSLVALGMVVSSYGAAMADTTSGEKSTSDGIFSWTYNGSGTLSVRKQSKTYPTQSGTWSSYYSDIKNMYIYGVDSDARPTYNYSDFETGMYNLKNIYVYDNCRTLKINNYGPKLETINFSNNSQKYITVDFSNRAVANFPEINYSYVGATNIDLDFSGYNGPVTVHIPASYGNDPKITYNFDMARITRIYFEEGTKTIPEDAFTDNVILSDVHIPDGVTKIEYDAFRNCEKLEKITIPSSVTSIGMNAFKYSGLKEITYGGTVEKWFGLVKEYNNDGNLVGDTLHLDGVTVHCSDGEVKIHKNADTYDYYQNVFGWVKQNGNWYYYTESGTLAKSSTYIDNVWYFFNKDGVMQTGWIDALGNGSIWYYANKSGALMEKGWLNAGGAWYYMNYYYMQTGWRTIDGAKYYLDKSSGKMATGWKGIDGKWYLFSSSGALLTGWQKSDSIWYYLDKSDGSMVTGWQQIDGKWYYFQSSGAMKTGWLKDGNSWYFLKADGSMATNWLKISGKWYYFGTNGVMVTGTKTIGGKTYNFDSNGVCQNP